MNHALLSVHVLAGIIFIGGSAVAASLFPRYAPITTVGDGAVLPASAEASLEVRNRATAAALHRVTGAYALLGLVVPIAGIILATIQGRMGEIWISLAMILTAVAGGLLAMLIFPLQREAIRAPDDGRRLRLLAGLTGTYNVLWATVVVLMIVRPGSS